MTAPARETARRRAIARRAVEKLAAHTDLRASLLAGSAALGTSDEHSDVDLLNYYQELPDQRAFDAAMRELGAERLGELPPPDDNEFAAFYRIDGVQVQTGAELITSVERRLKRIAAGDVDWITAKVAMGLLEGVPLHGDEILRGWQGRARYPESLRRSEVEANLGFFAIWALDEHLAARDAELFRRQMLLDGAFRVVAVLSAVNRLYFTTFQFKRAHTHTERMTVRPERLAERLDQVANEAPSNAAEELRKLVDETKAIVKAEMPDVDVDVHWHVGGR